MNRLSVAAALLGALSLTGLPATTAAAAADPTPPSGCASTTGYDAGNRNSARLTICFTQQIKYFADEGVNRMAPGVTVDAHCWHRTAVFWTEQNTCEWKGTLSMKKDGVEQWREPNWGKVTYSLHQHNTEQFAFYQCRGNGTYALTLDTITMLVHHSDTTRHVVPVEPVTRTSTGC